MLDYQRIVDDVRSSLYSHSAEGVDFLRAAAADYSVACDEVNERLRQCGSLLRQGLRSEAIQRAEIDPNLLDVVAILDFPERNQWIQLSQRNGIVPSTPLMLEVAATLNEAYALEQPLAALLQHHRLLALAHKPLPLRIQVLRRLADLDANNPVWQEDVRTFEQERQKQIQAEVAAATRTKNVGELDALDIELSNPDWKNPPPPTLARSAANAKATLNYWTTQSQLEELCSELCSAMSRRRLDLGEALYTRWNKTITGSGYQPHDQLAERAVPALAWVRNHLDHQAAIESLSNAIASKQPGQRLRESYNRASELGPLPSRLEERYRSRLAALERIARYRAWATFGGALATVAAVLAFVAWAANHKYYEQQVTDAAENIPLYIDDNKFEQAEYMWRHLPDESARNDPRLLEAGGLIRMTADVGDIPHYLADLHEFVKCNPNSRRSSDFKRAAKESPCWKAMGDEFRWIGWLCRNSRGVWGCAMKLPPKEAGELFVVYGQPGEKLSLKPIGQFNSNPDINDDKTPSSLVEGRPVYLKIQ